MLPDVGGRNCSVKLWTRPPAGLSSVTTEQPTKRPSSTSIGLGAECGDETYAAVQSERYASRYVGGSAATPTQCGLIAEGRMPTDRHSTP